MPYFVKRGEVHAGEVFVVGDELPEDVGDEAMVEAGAIEWVGEPGAADVPEVPAEEDAEAAPADSEPDLDAMGFRELQEAAKAAGVNSFGKSADVLRDELREVTP